MTEELFGGEILSGGVSVDGVVGVECFVDGEGELEEGVDIFGKLVNYLHKPFY